MNPTSPGNEQAYPYETHLDIYFEQLPAQRDGVIIHAAWLTPKTK